MYSWEYLNVQSVLSLDRPMVQPCLLEVWGLQGMLGGGGLDWPCQSNVEEEHHSLLGVIEVLRNTFLWRFDTSSTGNANNIGLYTFVMLIFELNHLPTPHLRYVTLEWPVS